MSGSAVSPSAAVRVSLLYAGNVSAASRLSGAAVTEGWSGAGSSADSRVQLGEGALWDAALGRLLWIDILGQRLHSYEPQAPQQLQHRHWRLPSRPGTVVSTLQPGVVLVAAADGLYYVDTGRSDGGIVAAGVDPTGGRSELRCNDGKTDSKGRLVVGTMALDEGPAGKERGGLFSIEGASAAGGGGPRCVQLLAGLSIPNGLAWSADGTRLWHTDTPRREVRQFPYEPSTGALPGVALDGYAAASVVIAVPEDFGFPDGCAIDENDNLWIASWGGGRVGQFSPVTGRLLFELQVGDGHVSRVSSVAFGGPELSDLYITTAAPDASFDYEAEPLAGSLFVARDIGVRGRASVPFAAAPVQQPA